MPSGYEDLYDAGTRSILKILAPLRLIIALES
jgi:hypothetical protein